MAVKVELDDQQALAFRLLSMAGAWDIKKGSIELHFDNEGMPRSAIVHSFFTLDGDEQTHVKYIDDKEKIMGKWSKSN